MKKALIILYYWPPAGGSAVQRWLKFCKFMPEYGWEPVVYAPENAQYPEIDENLKDQVPKGITIIKRPILEPFGLYKKFVGIKKEEKLAASMTLRTEPKGFAKLKNKFAFWVRSNFFIPDARRFWIRPSVRYLKNYLHSEKIDVIITTGPPQSLHLIGYHLHKKTGIPWVADFRDPWTSIDFYHDLSLTSWADKRHHMLESKVLRTASHVIAIGPNMKEEFLQIGARNITVITNGFDEGDLKDIKPSGAAKKFTVTHLGTLSASRNAPSFWKALSGKVSEDPQFARMLAIKLFGSLDHTVLKDLEAYRLMPYMAGTGFIPHEEALVTLSESHLLLLLINKSVNAKGVITGKFFEYLVTGRPVLLIGPLDGDAAAILKDTGGGLAVDYSDESRMRGYIDHLFDLYLKGEDILYKGNIHSYSRKSLTAKLAGLLDQIINE